MRFPFVMAALLLAHGLAVAQCTPATINSATFQKIRPRMPLSAVTALTGCAPDATVTALGIAAAWHTIDPGPVLMVFFDAEGVVSASFSPFLAPPVISGVGGLRVDEPKPNTWVVGGRP